MEIELDDGSTMNVPIEILFRKGELQKAKRIKFFTEFVINYLQFEEDEGIFLARRENGNYDVILLDENTRDLTSKFRELLFEFLGRRNQ